MWRGVRESEGEDSAAAERTGAEERGAAGPNSQYRESRREHPTNLLPEQSGMPAMKPSYDLISQRKRTTQSTSLKHSYLVPHEQLNENGALDGRAVRSSHATFIYATKPSDERFLCVICQIPWIY